MAEHTPASADVLALFLDSRTGGLGKALRGSSPVLYAHDAERWITYMSADGRDLWRPSPEDFAAFIEQLPRQRDTVSYATVARIRSVVRAFYAYARVQGWIVAVPFFGGRLPKSAPAYRLTPIEREMLAEAVAVWDGGIVRFPDRVQVERDQLVIALMRGPFELGTPECPRTCGLSTRQIVELDLAHCHRHDARGLTLDVRARGGSLKRGVVAPPSAVRAFNAYMAVPRRINHEHGTTATAGPLVTNYAGTRLSREHGPAMILRRIVRSHPDLAERAHLITPDSIALCPLSAKPAVLKQVGTSSWAVSTARVDECPVFRLQGGLGLI
ncbi:site-specific integrase [Streptomyces spectabilis]|uniref:site-specific integrase n=1 Tax=Streptomyces spectabilis TaxID=68270 RepID=UPI0033FAFB8B